MSERRSSYRKIVYRNLAAAAPAALKKPDVFEEIEEWAARPEVVAAGDIPEVAIPAEYAAQIAQVKDSLSVVCPCVCCVHCRAPVLPGHH